MISVGSGGDGALREVNQLQAERQANATTNRKTLNRYSHAFLRRRYSIMRGGIPI